MWCEVERILEFTWKKKKKKQSRAEAEHSHQANLLQVVQHHHPGIDTSQGVKRPPYNFQNSAWGLRDFLFLCLFKARNFLIFLPFIVSPPKVHDQWFYSENTNIYLDKMSLAWNFLISCAFLYLSLAWFLVFLNFQTFSAWLS